MEVDEEENESEPEVKKPKLSKEEKKALKRALKKEKKAKDSEKVCFHSLSETRKPSM